MMKVLFAVELGRVNKQTSEKGRGMEDETMKVIFQEWQQD